MENKILDDGCSIVGKKEDLIKYLTQEIINQFNELVDNISISENSIEDTFYNASMVYELMYKNGIFTSANDDDYLKINYDNGFGELMVFTIKNY